MELKLNNVDVIEVCLQWKLTKLLVHNEQSAKLGMRANFV